VARHACASCGVRCRRVAVSLDDAASESGTRRCNACCGRCEPRCSLARHGRSPARAVWRAGIGAAVSRHHERPAGHRCLSCRAWLADYRDLWTDHHALPGLPVVRLVERVIERRVLHAADVVTTVSAPLAERLRRQLMTKDVHVIENGVDPDDFAPLDPEPIFPRDGRVRLVYTGSIHPQQNVDAFFEALAVLARGGDSDIDRLDVQIATWTASYVRARAGRVGVAHLVTIRDAVPRDEALRMQRDADFLIFLPWADRAETGVLTGKVFEYICSGTPILMMGCDHQDRRP